MKKYTLSIILLVILIAGYILKSQKLNYYKIQGYAQGTTYSIIYGTKNNADYTDSVKNILHRFDQVFSSYITSSLISKINRNDTAAVPDKKFVYIFNLSKEINAQSQGAFDITVAPLVNAWGFGWEKKKDVDQHTIDSIMEFVGMNKVHLENGRIVKSDPRLQLDVNAIAQGYSVDIIAEFFNRIGVNNYMVEVGGELRASGTKQNNSHWKIGIEKPGEHNEIKNRPLKASVELKDNSLATSGNYRKFYEKDGMKFVHTINPKTGKTIKSNLLSVSVMTPECARADALATTFMVLGVEEGIKLAENLDGVDVYFIYSDENGNYKEWMTNGFKKVLKEIND